MAQRAGPARSERSGIPAAGYLVKEITDRVYWLTDGLYQMIFVTTAEGVVAVDAPPTIGKNILRAIATVTSSVPDAFRARSSTSWLGAPPVPM